MANVLSGRVLVTYGGFALRDEMAGGALRTAGLDLNLSPRSEARSADEIAHLLGDAVGAIADADPFDATVFERCPRLRVIARTGVGLDAIDLRAATNAGVLVTITEGVNSETVADHTLTLMLATLRRLRDDDERVRGGSWRSFDRALLQLHGRTVGIVGYGAIGKAVARRLHAFGARVLASDPNIPEADVPLRSVRELFDECDVVTLHMPLTPETHGLIDASMLGRLKPGAVLVNTSRGEVLDEQALIDALASGRLHGAGLDVFTREPPAVEKLAQLQNVILSPHVGGISDVTNLSMSRMATASVLAALQGAAVPGLVNPAALEVLRA